VLPAQAVETTHSDWLDRWQTALSDAPARQRLEALLAGPDAPVLVRSLPAQDVYLLVRELGLADAAALVAHCSGEQLQSFVDLEAWAGYRFDVVALSDWVRALVQGGCRDVPGAWHALDPPLRLLALKRLIHVQELEEDEDPDPIGAFVMDTPDRRYRVSARDDDHVDVVRVLLATQMAVEPASVSRMVADADATLASEAEELSFRFRNGRLADLGFPDPEEALALEAPFRSLDEARAELGRPAVVEAETHLSRWMLARPGEGLLEQALDALEDPAARARVSQELVYLCNAALVARDVDVGDAARVREEIVRIHAALSLGLRVLGAVSAATAAAVLSRSAARVIYRVTVTVLHRPRLRAYTLLDRAGRLGEDAEAFLERLAGHPPSQADGSPFSDPMQVRAAERRLEELEWAATWLREEGDADALTAFGTCLVRRTLGFEESGQPVPLRSFEDVLRRFVTAEGLDPGLVEAAIDAADGDAARRQTRAWCDRLGEEWGGLAAEATVEPRFVGGILLAAD